MTQTESLDLAAQSVEPTIGLLQAALAFTPPGPMEGQEDIMQRIAQAQALQADIRSLQWYVSHERRQRALRRGHDDDRERTRMGRGAQQRAGDTLPGGAGAGSRCRAFS